MLHLNNIIYKWLETNGLIRSMRIPERQHLLSQKCPKSFKKTFTIFYEVVDSFYKSCNHKKETNYGQNEFGPAICNPSFCQCPTG